MVRSVAAEKCKQMRGRLALLNNAEQFNFVASIAVLRDPANVTYHGWWTGAANAVVNIEAKGRTYLQWEGGSPQYSLMTYPDALKLPACVETLFHIRAFGTIACETSMLRYVCEKDAGVA